MQYERRFIDAIRTRNDLMVFIFLSYTSIPSDGFHTLENFAQHNRIIENGIFHSKVFYQMRI